MTSPPEQSVEAAAERLRTLVRAMGSVLVAYSGGLDSALVLAVATRELGDRAVGLTAVGPALPVRERDEAAAFAARIGARHLLVESHEIDDPGYVANPENRCFYCKSELYRITARESARLGLAHVANGTNLDDLGDRRPGLEAAARAGVRSPLLEARLAKDDVRAVARHLGLPVWDKPASACLASRIPFGTSVTLERLAQVERLENALKDFGFRKVRVRYHGEIARIEIGSDELPRAMDESLRAQIVRAGKDAGFTFVTLDLAGYRLGSLDELIRARASTR